MMTDNSRRLLAPKGWVTMAANNDSQDDVQIVFGGLRIPQEYFKRFDWEGVEIAAKILQTADVQATNFERVQAFLVFPTDASMVQFKLSFSELL